MKHSVKRSGQKLTKRFFRFSRKATEDGIEHVQENLVERLPNVRRVRLLVLEWLLLVGIVIFLAITQGIMYRNSYAVITYGNGGTYTEATLGKVNSLNPLFASTSSEKTLSKLLFACLSAPDYSGHTGLDLAESIKSDQSGKVWSIKLRDNLKWSDGSPITNEDVLYTVDIIQDPKVNTSYSSNLANVKVMEDANGRIIFDLPRAYANFPSALNIPVLPAHILKDVSPELLLEHSFSTTPVTSGPFTYNAAQAIGTEGEKLIYLLANPNYYKGKPMLDSFAVHAYLDTDKIISALRNGSVTATAELSAADSDEVLTSNLHEKQTALSSGIFAFFNMDSPTLSNKVLRASIRLGVDWSQLRNLSNSDTPLQFPITNNQIDIDAYPEIPAYNQSAAQQALAGVTLPEEAQINIVTVTSFSELADNLASQLTALGLSVSTNVYEPNQDFLINVIRPRAYDILIYEVELGPDPDLFAYYHSSQASATGLNLSNYRNVITDDLVLGARSSTDPKLRSTKYQNFLRYWVDDIPAVGIAQVDLSYYLNKNVRSFSESNRLVYATDRFTDVSYWAAEKTVKNRTP
ncbi:hypothetical protein IJG73_02050 [Candidatus Saccharibacteria bacterium]|nr:hypothetical protein [Candidatus Saccharibacteria bacterium]